MRHASDAESARALYHSYYVNFTPAVPRPLLEELATATLESESVSQVSKVVDQYLNFASLEEDLFTLMQPRAYATLHVIWHTEDLIHTRNVHAMTPPPLTTTTTTTTTCHLPLGAIYKFFQPVCLNIRKEHIS